MESAFANVGNTHDVAPITSSKVGAVQGCGGPATSPEALQQEGLYRMASTVGGGKRRYHTLAGGKRHTKRRRLSKRRRPKTHRRRRHHRGGQHDSGAMRDTVIPGTNPEVSDTNTTGLASKNTPSPFIAMGGRKSRRQRRHHKKSRKHTRKHRRRSSRRMRGGDGVYAAALTPSYSSPGELESSALASPPPIVRTNNCLDTYKHLGDKPPYNEEWKGIN
jgi:hypothetical protein